MGIYDREYYRGETRGATWLTGAAPVCRTIILINVGVFLAERILKLDHNFIDTWLAASTDGIFGHFRIHELITATFLHGDISHLIVNMLFLWVVGRDMEAMYGSTDFLAFYLSAGAVSTLTWAVCTRIAGGHSVMLGASGAVLATAILYATYYPRRELLLMFVIPVEMWLLVALFMAYQVFLVVNPGNSHVAVESHLAGAAYGYLFKRFDFRWSHLGLWKKRRPKFRVISPEPREKTAVRPSGPSWSPNPASLAKPSATAVLPEEQLDARLDEVLAKIAREGRAALTDEENRVLQEASRRARNKRSEPL